MKRAALLAAGWVVFACASAWAEVPRLYVKTAADSGNDATGDGSWDAPYATIQRAMDVAVKVQKNALTTISVQPDVYPGSNYVSSTSYFVDVRAQKRVNGVDVDNDNPRETVIDGSINRQFGFDLRGWKTSGEEILYRQSVCGFTVTNGRARSGRTATRFPTMRTGRITRRWAPSSAASASRRKRTRSSRRATM